MAALLVELGCEELPASEVRRAYTYLRAELVKGCLEAGLITEVQTEAVGTPRRLIVRIEGLRDRQEDSVKEQRGPALKAAYSEGGEITPALLGFCRSIGVSPEDLRQDEAYVWARVSVVGRSAVEILAELIPKAIRGLTFDKTMRWGASRSRFARPIRWLVALLGDVVVPFEIEGVVSGRTSRGHRFYSASSFEVESADGFVEALRARRVEADPERRRQMILSGIKKAVSKGEAELREELVDENVFLTEWPDAVEGEFGKEYLNLPGPVLVTAMAKHEKMFPVRDAKGRLLNRFVFVRNAGEPGTVRKGAEWVLNARFNDAKFFFDEDKKSTLDGFLEKTSAILFAEKLGTIRQRADRLAALAEAIATETGADKDEQILARTAGLYAKADLSTGLVSELASLQGVIGGEYARREGMLDEVCTAIASQYDLSKHTRIASPSARTAVRLVVADQLDKLAGYLGLGLAPTGSSDPYGLRRAATLLIEAAWQWPNPMPPYSALIGLALAQYEGQGVVLDGKAAKASLIEIFASRYEALMADVRYDIRDAAMLVQFEEEVTRPQGVRFRASLLKELGDDLDLIQTATRPLNIVEHARKKSLSFEEAEPLDKLDLSALDSVDAASLFTVLKAQEELVKSASVVGDKRAVLKAVQNLAEPIKKFFDSTMVMAEEEDVRTARLSLMQAASLQLFAAGDFSKLVIEG